MHVPHRPIIVLLWVTLLVSLIGGHAGAASSGITGQVTITDSAHYTADTTANVTTASTTCTLSIALNGSDQARATVSYTAQQVQDQRTPGTEDKRTTQVQGSGSASYDAGVSVVINQDGSYQIDIGSPVFTANVTYTREVTNEPTTTSTATEQVSCPIANGGELTGRVGHTSTLAGSQTNNGRFGNTDQEYGSSKVTWSVQDPNYRPNPSAPLPPAPKGPPPGMHLAGNVSVTDQASFDNSSSATTSTAKTNCTVTITLNKDGSATATANYTAHQVYDQSTAGIEEKRTTDVQGTGTFYYEAGANASIAQDGSYQIYIGSPVLAANVTYTREVTNEPTTTSTATEQVSCPIANGGELTGHVDRNSNTLKGDVNDHGHFGNTGQESGTSDVRWTIIDVYIVITVGGGKGSGGSSSPTPPALPTTKMEAASATPTPRRKQHGGSATPTATATQASMASGSTITQVTDAPNGPTRILYRPSVAKLNSTVDGNTDTVTVEITNGSNAVQTGTIEIRDRAWGMLARKSGVSVRAHSRQTFTLRMATDGLAWKPRPSNLARNADLLLTAAFAGLTSTTARVAIEPRPVVMVHGLNDTFMNWFSWWKRGGFLAHAGYPASRPGMYGWPVNTLNTNGQGPIVDGNNVVGLVRANTVACQTYHLCQNVVKCSAKAKTCTNTTEQNAQLLGNYIEQRVVVGAHAEKIDLVAQSMGGLIARYYISNFMPTHRAARLIMLGTPNMGSMAGLIGTVLKGDSNQPATFENSPAFVERVLNPASTNRKGVRYFAVGGTFNGCNPVDSTAVYHALANLATWKGVPYSTMNQMLRAVCANLATHCYSTDGLPSDMVVSAASTRTLPFDAPASIDGRNPQFPLDTIRTQLLPNDAFIGLPVYHFDSDFPFTPGEWANLFGSGSGNCQDMAGWDQGKGSEQTSPIVFNRVRALWLTNRSLATPRNG